MADHHNTPKKLTIRIPVSMLDTAKGKAGNDGVSLNEYVVAAIAHYNARGASDALHNRELSGFGRRDEGNPLAAMEWVLARSPRAADLQDASGVLDKRIAKYIARKLTAAQSRRFLLHLRGYSYTEIATFEPANPTTGKPPIKQAICKSVQQAERCLRDDPDFKALLIAIVQPKARATWYDGEEEMR